jgi:hypothetical protein
MPSEPVVTLYTRAGCCLCDEARKVLLSAARRARFRLEEIDIDADAALRAQYNEEIPLIAINGAKVFQYSVDLEAFLKQLAARA